MEQIQTDQEYGIQEMILELKFLKVLIEAAYRLSPGSVPQMRRLTSKHTLVKH